MAMFTPEEIETFRLVGGTEQDALRTLRDNGPLDRTIYRTVCTGCGETVRHSLRWFHNCQFRCHCGSEFDGRELRRYLIALSRRDSGELRSITAVELVEDYPDHDTEG